MICPQCSSKQIFCTDSRHRRKYGMETIIRRRACDECLHRWSTYEIGGALLKKISRIIKAMED